MKLSDGEKGKTYLVRDVHALPSVTRRLEALGVNTDTRITLTNRKKTGTVIIKVRGTWLALGQKIARDIEIMPEGQPETDPAGKETSHE